MTEPDNPTSDAAEEVITIDLPAWITEVHGETREDGSMGTYIPLPDAHPLYAMVGRVVSEWAHLEHVLDQTIWTLLSNAAREETACITAQIMGVRPRCLTIISLSEAHGIKPETVKKVRKLMADSFKVSDLRNRWVHDPWYFDVASRSASQFRSMPAPNREFGFIDVAEDRLSHTIDETRKLKKRAFEFRLEIQGEIEALRDTPLKERT
ncbi:hypothetical protein G5B40_11185 [Pikeienuella piscinae]|uniref:Uncharacterized protein n=1 Tax=Pikeienuella piscinae TaxID=2748098 RepID=A0A7L5BZL8_9RHOB|nr:hypothetical protein [Pikeienuella piscinae]QIE55967.1 hypothetical protein G5B40_11185 [Pikeienuella piscinae]